MMTKIMFSVSILLVIVTLSAAGTVGVPTHISADQSLMKYMMRSRFSNDPSRSMHCFGYYMPLLNNITEELSKSYQKCTADGEDRMGKLNDAAMGDRRQIELAADSICVRLDACNDKSESLDYFDCISRQGSNNTKVMYTVTRNSTDKGAELREQYHIVHVDTVKCWNASERAYLENTASTYIELDICLKTGNIPSTTTPENTTPTTTKNDKETTTVVTSSTDNANWSTVSSSSSTNNPNSSSTSTEGPVSVPPENEPKEELPTGRSMKILSDLRRFWRN